MKFILLIICYIYCQDGNLYKKMGKDWPGLCGTGSNQSPINIIEANTKLTGIKNFKKKTMSSLITNYQKAMPKNSTSTAIAYI